MKTNNKELLEADEPLFVNLKVKIHNRFNPGRVYRGTILSIFKDHYYINLISPYKRKSAFVSKLNNKIYRA